MNVDFEAQDIIVEFTPEGQDGKSVRPKGEWSATAQYVELDLVGYHGNSYIALSTVPVGTLPTDTEYWMTNASNETPYWGNIEGTLSEQTDLQNALDAKADADEVYTKTETDDLLALKADADDVYTKAEADDLLDFKADKADSYTKDELDGIFDGIDNALNTKADTDSVYTKAETDSLLSDKADADDVYTKSQVYTKSETDDLLSTKANTADLGTLAGMNSIDYASNYLTNKPTLGSLADQDTVDYATEVTNKPTLGDLAALNSIDYTSNYLTNKPTLGSLADHDTVDYETEVTNKPTLGTMSAESASDYYDKDEVNDLINASGVVAELDASGSIATFETNLTENLSRLNVSIDPVQDLHGYDNPWPAGGGKNLLDVSQSELGGINSSGTEIISVDNWRGTEYIPITGGLSYVLSTTIPIRRIYFYDENKNFISPRYEESYDPVVATAPANAKYARWTVYKPNGITEADVLAGNLQLEQGSSATSFAPYSNVCPISGHSSATVTRTGKNIMYKVDTTHALGIDGVGLEYRTSPGTILYFWGVSGRTYCYNRPSDANRGSLAYFGVEPSNGDHAIEYDANMYSTSFTCTRTGIYLLYIANSAIDTSGVQIQLGSTASSYEPYTGTSVTIALGDTYYGAQLDAVAGTLTVEKVMIDLDNRGTWSKSTSYPGGFYLGYGEINTLYDTNFKRQTPFICSHAKTVTTLAQYLPGTCYCDNSVNIRIMDADATIDQWKQYLQDQYDAGAPVQICFYLATPTVITGLTPAQIQALQGLNNVWSDTGDVAVSYFSNSTAEAITDVKQMIASTETSMTATRNYTSGSLIIVGSAMYKALSNIASGSTLVIGSNVQRTTLEEWILALLA